MIDISIDPLSQFWSVFNQSVRKNNYVEGWQRCLNYRAGNGSQRFYILVLLLDHESHLLKLQSKLFMEGKLQRYQHRVYYLNSGVNTSQKTATHQYFSRHAGKYMPLLSRLFSILRPGDTKLVKMSVLFIKISFSQIHNIFFY